MTYDPFARGPFPAGVRTLYAADPTRDGRPLTFEVWYPAAAAHAGQDLADDTRDRYEMLPVFPPVPQDAVRDAAPQPGAHPLVMFSHGFGSHRRQSTFFCTHLASRGYVVASVDHTGNTTFDILQATIASRSGAPPPDGDALIAEFIAQRPADVSFMLAQLDAGALGADGPAIDASRIGMSGHSFGGWTTLMAVGREPRIVAAVPLAPAGGATPLGGQSLRDALSLDWRRRVPTLLLAAERDGLLPLEGMEDLFRRIDSPKRMSILRNADHMHFCDRAESVHEMFRMMPPAGGFAKVAKTTPAFSELCPAAPAYDWVRGLGTAHFDAYVQGNEAAVAFLAREVPEALRARGIDATPGETIG